MTSGDMDMAGTANGIWGGLDMVEPTLSRLDVVRYADCSASGYLSELGMLNHSSVPSSARVLNRDLDLPVAIVLSCSPRTQLAVSEWPLDAVDLTNDSS